MAEMHTPTAFDAENLTPLSVVFEGRRWAIKHGDGYLGFADTQAEALALMRFLSAPEIIRIPI